MNNLTDEEQQKIQKYEARKKQNRDNSKTYYTKNKAQILAKRKEKREKDKQDLEEITNRLAISTIRETENNTDFGNDFDTNFEPELENEIIQPTNKKLNYTKDEIINLLQNDNSIKSNNTRKTYITDIKRLFTITKCPDLKHCLKEFKTMITQIKNSKYSVNSIKTTLQALLYVFDKYQILNNIYSKKYAVKVKKSFSDAFEVYKMESKKQTKTKQENTIYPSFKEHLDKVKTAYGENSKEYLIIYLYSIFTLRDNYKEMKIIDNKKDDDDEHNFFYLNQNTNEMIFIINDYKTKEKYNKLIFKVTDKKLKQLLINWINKKKFKYGQYLFGKSSLSTFISKINKTVGYKNIQSINAMRHMRVTELFKNKENPTWEERRQLADDMAHSLLVQEDYKRQLKVI